MTTYFEHHVGKPATSINALSGFPAKEVGQPLLSVIESETDGVIIVDALRRIVLVNDIAERMFGYPAHRLLEQPLELLLPTVSGYTSGRRKKRLMPVRIRTARTKLELKGMHASGEQLSVSVCVLRVAVQGEYYLALVLDKATLAGKDDASVFQLPELLVEHRRRAVSSQQANEVEKKRFSRKLYDDIGQRLSVLKLDLDWLENSLSDADACFPARLAEMQGLLDNVISMTKSMASALRPPLLDDFGLLPAVEWIAENFSKKTSIACTVENNSMVGKLDEAVESAVFRIVQESLSNIERHACAQHAKIILTQCKDRLDVMIQDDGIGMTTGCENKLGCYGLIAMQERVFVLGGTIYIRHIKPHGVCIHASLPLEPIFNATQCSIPSTRNL